MSTMTLTILFGVTLLALLGVGSAELVPGFRPVAIPLFTFSPNLHGWLRGDNLYDQAPTMWFEGTQNSTMVGYIRVDGVAYRFLGLDYITQTFANNLLGTNGTDRPGTELPGSPITLDRQATSADCALLCIQNASCQSWSFKPHNPSSACQQTTGSSCSLRSSVGTPVPDQCRFSDRAIVHLSNAWLDGVPNVDRPGDDIAQFDLARDAVPLDCAKRCWTIQGCDTWVFAHPGCDNKQGGYCWVKGNSSTPGPAGDCRRTGFGPPLAGWSPPTFNFTTPVIKQTALRVQPTQTIATFEGAGVKLTLTWTQTAYPMDFLSSSHEYVYITTEVTSTDGSAHAVQIYIDHGSDLVTSVPSSPNDQVVWSDVSSTITPVLPNARAYVMSVPTAVPFSIRGDETRPNSGDLYFVSDSAALDDSTVASAELTRTAFIRGQKLPPFDTNQPRTSNGAGAQTPVTAFVFDLKVSSNATEPARAHSTLFYDEKESINYFGQIFKPYWTNVEGSTTNSIIAALMSYPVERERANTFDAQLIRDVTGLTGDRYATLLSLIHRQVTGCGIVVWNDQKKSPWYFIKEMSTGGAISTVDVVFPAAPFYIALAPEMLKQLLMPLISWSNNETSSKVTITWAPHDLASWPVCDANAAQQEEMPLEESGNMLLMLAGIAQRQNGDVSYLLPYRAVIQQWADFVNSTMPDPGDQLCTDDFEGPSPHNANLAVKGIISLNAWAIILRYMGDNALAREYDRLASVYAQDWIKLAADPVGMPHFKQRYDQSNTWSFKYNLVWQYILGTNAFPESVRLIENAFYQAQSNQYGIPMDNRHEYVKSDWFSWVGALAANNNTQQNNIINYLYNFANTSPDRHPFTDLFDTTTNHYNGGFVARFVMGGLYSIPIVNAIQELSKLPENKNKQGLELLNGLFEYDHLFPKNNNHQNIAAVASE